MADRLDPPSDYQATSQAQSQGSLQQAAVQHPSNQALVQQVPVHQVVVQAPTHGQAPMQARVQAQPQPLQTILPAGSAGFPLTPPALVSPAYFPAAETRRHLSSRMSGYGYSERRGSPYPVHPEQRVMMGADRDGSEEPQPAPPARKRIAVACGRCRKRKIRCSGDSGNGQPCTNCKSAGHDNCQFLRVASQETPLKNESFPYSLEVSRQYQTRGASIVAPPPPSTVPYSEGLALPHEGMGYRSSTSYSYGRPPYPMAATWPHGLPSEDQPVQYPVYTPSFQPIQEEYATGTYRLSSNASPRLMSGALYVEPETPYGYSTGSSMINPNLVHRPAAEAGSGSFAYHSPAVGMSSSVSSDNKPLPVSGRALPGSGLVTYRNDSMASPYSKPTPSSSSGTAPATPNSDVASSYTAYETSSMPSSYAPVGLATQFPRPESLYSTTATAGSSDNFTTSDSPRASSGPPLDMQYRYTDTTTRRDGTSTVGAAVLSLSHGPTTSYVPHAHGHGGSYVHPSEVTNTTRLMEETTDTTPTAEKQQKPAGPVRV